MTVCDWCFITYFDDNGWARERYKAHHRTCASWARSLRQPCTICVTLAERTRAVLEDAKKLYDADTSPDRAQQSYSDVLLQWLEQNESRLNPLLPLYRVQMQEGGAKHEWLLRFVGSNDAAGSAITLPTQKFVVYGAHCESLFAIKLSSPAEVSRTADDQEEGRDDRPPRIGNSTESEATFDQVRTWLGDCAEHHITCKHLRDQSRARYGNFMPTRVIDVVEKRLVETKSTNIMESYMTLSHCWGGEPEHQLTDDTHSGYLQSLPYEQLPLSFQHAITITRRLGIRYLWIDSLCIIQKQPDPKPDWSAEAPNMARVYGNSYCNIAAVSSFNSKQGIFRPRRLAGLPPSLARVRWSGQNVLCRVVRDDFWTGELLGEPLYTRGWVFQERMLSPRILHFHRKQVFWQCLGLTACESIPHGLSRVVDDERRDELRWRQILHKERKRAADGTPEPPHWTERADLNAIWRVAVRSYTCCNLTVKTDKLIALASIASAMQELLGEKYVAGMWGQDALLIDQLCWKVEEWYVRKSWEGQDKDEYRAPSWSWASLDAVVRMPARIQHEFRRYVLEIEKDGLELDLAMKDVPTGQLVSGRLKVNGKLFRVKFCAPKGASMIWTRQRTVLADGDQGRPQEFCGLTPDKDISSLTPITGANAMECCLLILAYERVPPENLYNGFALALNPASGGDAFTRLGIVEFRGFLDTPEKSFSPANGIEEVNSRQLILV